ncbi:methyltransferase domain-containing protein [Micromonospora haikouensis]|uniref:methyltransferase domain-containing protein n=1 Tax=Micromonospora haikouensis TaxID=686309 RepID=UPI0030CA380E
MGTDKGTAFRTAARPTVGGIAQVRRMPPIPCTGVDDDAAHYPSTVDLASGIPTMAHDSSQGGRQWNSQEVKTARHFRGRHRHSPSWTTPYDATGPPGKPPPGSTSGSTTTCCARRGRARRCSRRRAAELGLACRYVVAELPGAPLRDGCADLVYTGKGALIWMRDLAAWARDVARLLRPAGHLFVYEAHPAAALWSWDADEPRIRADRSYFGDCFVNDTFPGNGAVEFQWTLGEIVNVVLAAGLELLHLAEHPEPFWRPGGITAAAWSGRLPNAFSLLARRRPEPAR